MGKDRQMNSSMKDCGKCKVQRESIELGDKRRKVTEQSIYIARQVRCLKKEKGIMLWEDYTQECVRAC